MSTEISVDETKEISIEAENLNKKINDLNIKNLSNKKKNINNLNNKKKNIFLILGLAGSGKTTFFQRLSSWLTPKKVTLKPNGLPKTQFTINLDTASILELVCDYDIRDYINYHETLAKHQLGPNGGILTCLNIHSLSFLDVLDKIPDDVENILIDTPGQIEAFTWSSSGQLIVDLLNLMKKNGFELKILFLIDSNDSVELNTFVTNMVTSCIIKYRFNCELLCLFNKIDIDSEKTQRLRKWIKDYDSIAEYNRDDYASDILSTLALSFEDIYRETEVLEVSGKKGLGKEAFLKHFNIST
ncbi:GPN-loop GTPase 1 [Cucumispora dikerogammari]|nr:GPN-loop GTPase 1 [Cucumispora dikerogammari]